MNKSLIINNSFFRLLAPVFTGIFAYLLIVLLNNDLASLPSIFKGQEVYVCIFLTYILSETQRLMISFLQVRRQELNSYAIILQIFSGLMLDVVITTGVISLYFQVFLSFSISESQIIMFTISYSIITLLYHLLYISNYFFYEQNTEQLDYEERLKDDIHKNIKSYHNTVNPQLLYHSLETLITLVHKNANEAEDFVDHLSAIYRHILSNRNKEFVSLHQELKAVEHIIFLLNHEYNGLIHFKNRVVDNKILILPGTITMLIEQTVRTNIITPLSPMLIELTEEPQDGYLILKNRLNKRLYTEGYFADFIESLQQSYYFYSEKPIVQVKAHSENFLKLPLLTEARKKEVIPVL